jgi:hypothetical protein
VKAGALPVAEDWAQAGPVSDDPADGDAAADADEPADGEAAALHAASIDRAMRIAVVSRLVSRREVPTGLAGSNHRDAPAKKRIPASPAALRDRTWTPSHGLAGGRRGRSRSRTRLVRCVNRATR